MKEICVLCLLMAQSVAVAEYDWERNEREIEKVKESIVTLACSDPNFGHDPNYQNKCPGQVNFVFEEIERHSFLKGLKDGAERAYKDCTEQISTIKEFR
ncbi:MAG: hypothetical protein OXG15_00280 [Gammaproteobacteria bacterium]|nr:hypothetical protein [Gammaproteobacteria bacterium]